MYINNNVGEFDPDPHRDIIRENRTNFQMFARNYTRRVH